MPIANLEDMRRIEVRTEDELNRTVLIKLHNDQLISVSLEERDASELVLVLKGYFHLITGQTLPVDQEETTPIEDLAPPYLSQHKVIPEKWSYVNQNQMKTVCFTAHPIYQGINRKTNGLYNTVGRQSKPPLMMGYSLDSNMNNSFSNRNHQYGSFDSNSYDLQSVVSMEILESGIVEAKNDEVLRRVQEMQMLVENSEKYLTEQERLNSTCEWQETSVDIESDGEEVPGILKHSDSLLLLTKVNNATTTETRHFANAAIEVLRSELNQSESDNDSIYTPHNSPRHKFLENGDDNKSSRLSFGLHSPDTTSKDDDFKNYLQRMREMRNNESTDVENLEDLYVFDPDIIDLTLLPPPATPDELDCALPTPINVPPSNFADSIEQLDLEEFLASVTVPPPTQKTTPVVELTPEEIKSYIIPPPPNLDSSLESLTIQENKNVIEYATVDRKGPFSCCAKNKTKSNGVIQPPPRRSSDEKPPERPPKLQPQERQRSQSLTSATITKDFPPKLPPRCENNHQAPPHLFLPPKKPPLPPVPPLEVLRQRKTMSPQPKINSDVRTAGIGSPHLQRNKNLYNDLEGERVLANHSTAVSTPTSPHLGKLDLQPYCTHFNTPIITSFVF